MGSESGPPRKRPRGGGVPAPAAASVGGGGDGGLGGLYDFLPPPDPKKDEAAKETSAANHRSRAPLPPEDRSRVIFLDVDGVLLPTGAVETMVVDGVRIPTRDTVKESDFATAALGNLRAIIQQTGATVVLSSEWRRTDSLRMSIQAVLKSQEIPTPFRDVTPLLGPKPELQRINPILAWCERRAREIGIWLKEHPDVTAWVVLDDLDFVMADNVRAVGTPWIKYRSVHTNDKHCITEVDAQEAVRILQYPPPEPKTLVRGP